jgi:hypothetical protein
MPAWFNEGLASVFSSELALPEMFAMLRAGEPLDLRVLESRSFAGVAKDVVVRRYWQAVAMTMYAIERADGSNVAGAVRWLGGLGAADATRLSAWRALAHHDDANVALDALARRVFGTTAGLDALLHGPMCCYAIRDFVALGCRAPASREDRDTWNDRSREPIAACKLSW